VIDLILHDSTRRQLEQFIARPTHAVLLTGPTGAGKRAIADALVAEVLGVELPRLGSYPYFLPVGRQGDSISIDAVRNLQKFLQLKTVGDNPVRRAIVIEYAHALTKEAQNAFLKLLEEPPADTLIVLTVSTPRSLLPTIISRAQTITVHTPTEEQLAAMLSGSGKEEALQRQAYSLSGGLPGLLHALLYDEEGHPLLTSVNLAKEVLQKSAFERLAMVDGLSKQKEAALGLVEALERIAGAGLSAAGSRQDTPHIRSWHHIHKVAAEAKNALRQSGNAKLVLCNLFHTLNR
jgi:DNA polymerase III delta prime subunit